VKSQKASSEAVLLFFAEAGHVAAWQDEHHPFLIVAQQT
jgi:hypothetical protein